MQKQNSKRTERLIALAIVATLLFNYPVLALFGGAYLPLGIPLLYLYLFASWALVITFVALVMSAGRERDPDRHERE